MPTYKKKKWKYKKIVNESLEGKHQGFGHRDHRTKKGKKKFVSRKAEVLNKIKDKEHQAHMKKYDSNHLR